jgi:hypothetical protein
MAPRDSLIVSFPMEDRQEIHRIAAFLARRGEVDATAAQIAEAVFTKCQAIEAALTPIIGLRGVAALHRRGLHLAARSHPWLADALPGEPASEGRAILKTLLSRQTSADAALGGAAFLQAFYDLLASLVGLSLTERLLRSAWIDFLGAPPAQDTSP